MAKQFGNWKQQAVIEGHAMNAQVGTLSTPIQGGGAGTILVIDEPQATISVPTGTAILLMKVRVDCQVPLLATDADEIEIVLAIDRAAAVADGTATAETPLNMRTDLNTSLLGVTTAPTVKSAYTVAMTDPVLTYELAHPVKVGDVQTAVGTTWTKLGLDYDPEFSSAIVGPATVIVYWGGTVAVTGFANLTYAAYNTTDLTT